MVKLTEELVTLDPRDKSTEFSPGIPARETSLDGKVVGLLSNNKPNSELLLRRVADLVKEHYAIKEVVEANKGSHRIPAPQEMIDDLAARCDLVVVATAE
jgi:hypothetical protein